jgi:hypothetical protein
MVDGMRTTLDIDPRLLTAARGRVAAGLNRTIGQAVSELALAHLALTPADQPVPGLVLLPTTPGHVITDQMVEEALADG